MAKKTPAEMTRGERMDAGLCANCAQKGPHYVPPSGGGTSPGFFLCESIDESLEEKVARLQTEVDRLQERSDRLARLEAAGVDNWEGYSAAFRDDEEEDGD